MSLKAGIVGLPNVGKSTLFNAITKKNILIANYPFATIDPNVGVVNVPDNRLQVLANIYEPKQIKPEIILNSCDEIEIGNIDKEKGIDCLYVKGTRRHFIDPIENNIYIYMIRIMKNK